MLYSVFTFPNPQPHVKKKQMLPCVVCMYLLNLLHLSHGERHGETSARLLCLVDVTAFKNNKYRFHHKVLGVLVSLHNTLYNRR